MAPVTKVLQLHSEYSPHAICCSGRSNFPSIARLAHQNEEVGHLLPEFAVGASALSELSPYPGPLPVLWPRVATRIFRHAGGGQVELGALHRPAC